MNKVCIGKIVNTHGIKGELRVQASTNSIDKRFKPKNKIYIGDKEYKVKNFRLHKKFVLLTLEGFYNINDVINLKNKKIYVYISKDTIIKETKDGDIHLLMIKDYQVFDLRINKIIGCVTDMYINNHNDILVVKNKNHKEILIPIINKFIKDIDHDNKLINVELIQGFHDEN